MQHKVIMNPFLRIAILLGWAAALPAGNNKLLLDGKIVGGQAVTIEDVPYLLSLEYNSLHICGASIIGHSWALSAAHCTESMTPSSGGLRAGSSAIGSGGDLHPILNVVHHPLYDPFSMDYDLSVIQIVGEFSYRPGVAAISLSTALPSSGAEIMVSGWGSEQEGGAINGNLKVVTLVMQDHTECLWTYYPYNSLTERMFCAGAPAGGLGACEGDTGGPAVAGGVQVGVVSWGYGCGKPEFHNVYASVPNMLSWINETVPIIY